MVDHSTVIIGAGLTGLSCSLHLGGGLVLEKENEPGGIVRTRTRHGGFYCDGTGHWLHLRDPAMKKLVHRLLPGGLVEYERRAVVFSHGVFTPYPFQANTFGLPNEVILECVVGLLKAKHPEDFGLNPPSAPPANFGEWVDQAFGEGISRHFMAPYNRKLLGVDLAEMMPDYAERFIPRPSTEDVIRGALGFSRESLGYNSRFLYPKHGGIGALPAALANALKESPVYGTAVTAIDASKKTVTLGTGKTISYKNLVNTMPLVNFVPLIQDVPAEVLAATKRLRATTVKYFDIGVRGPGGPASDYHWIYCPEPEIIFYRAGSYSAVHKEAAPPGCRSYYVEMSGDPEGLMSQPEKLKQRVLGDLIRLGVLSKKDEVLFMELSEIPHAYVIFDRQYDESRFQVLEYLKSRGILSGGRWGGWGYGGMEDAMLDGKAAAEQILKGS
jgi:protoporphyrinogen oxidase